MTKRDGYYSYLSFSMKTEGKTMKITILINDQEQTFTTPFIAARMFRRALELLKTYDLNDLNVEALDALVDFCVEVFREKFTRDQFYDGIAADKFTDTLLDIIYKVAGIVGEPKNPNV
jgi:hypothetical protein